MVFGNVGTGEFVRSTFGSRTFSKLLSARRRIVTVLYLISGIIALGLFIYLFVALLKPEKFG